MKLIFPGTASLTPNDQPVAGLPIATSVASDDNVLVITASNETKIVSASNFQGSGVGGTGGLVGTGSPEGVKVAAPGTPYFDTDTDNLWYKATGSGNTGWRQLFA